MKLTKNILRTVIVSIITLAMHTVAISGNGPGGLAGNDDTNLDPRFDTSFAVEYSDSCLSGCHENDSRLVEEHAGSFMTHLMVKCNACHGTHTADTVGKEKPNLTGYYPGIGSTGYQVGDDRCIACHSATFDNPEHPNKTWDCASCHVPHEFAAGKFNSN